MHNQDRDLNLNKLKVRTVNKDGEVQDWHRELCEVSESGDVSVYFEGLEALLINHINKASVCLGCVAWLTSEPILQALATKKLVSIIVQKEDFLRPDFGTSRESLRKLYKSIPHTVDSHDYREWFFDFCWYQINEPAKLDAPPERPMEEINAGWEWKAEAIRCVGSYSRNNARSSPRMHHKFLLFCNERANPYAVWTGSFNFTWNASRSFENALYIEDKEIVTAYWKEWAYIFALSEPLNWEKDEVNPEFHADTTYFQENDCENGVDQFDT